MSGKTFLFTAARNKRKMVELRTLKSKEERGDKERKKRKEVKKNERREWCVCWMGRGRGGVGVAEAG